jgi:hypothetical protein
MPLERKMLLGNKWPHTRPQGLSPGVSPGLRCRWSCRFRWCDESRQALVEVQAQVRSAAAIPRSLRLTTS